MSQETKDNLWYFVKQELGFFNSLVEQLTPRLRSFPQDYIDFKDKEKRLWEACAEHAADIDKMVSHSVEQWPEKLRHLNSYLRDQEGNLRISPGHLQMIRTACTPARLHPMVRRQMAVDIMKYMGDQAETIKLGAKSEGFRSPLQMLNVQTIDTKRHLQIPSVLVSYKYDEEGHVTRMTVPYSKNQIEVPGYDISEIPHKMLVIRAPHPTDNRGSWRIDLRDQAYYGVTSTDFFDRRRR